MDSKRAFVWAAKYFLVTSLFALVGLALVAGGLAFGALEGYDVYQATDSYRRALVEGGPGIALAAGGVLVYRFGKAWALFKTLPGAVEADVAETFDTEHVKSDIVSLLDDRLSDMQHEIQSLNREVSDLTREEGDDDLF